LKPENLDEANGRNGREKVDEKERDCERAKSR